MSVDRVKFQDIVASQLPSFIRDDFPLLSEFLEEYYVSQETQGATLDLLQNIDKYVNVDQLTGLKSSTVLQSDIDSVEDVIPTDASGNFTEGFVDRNGLIQIGDEIIAYETKTDISFEGCKRGFSGITSYVSPDIPDRLSFSSGTDAVDHQKGAVIKNLNVLFLQEFFRKLKAQVSPGFGDRSLKTNEKNFIINSDSFYKTKGTDLSYKILFKALFGEEVEIIRPSQFLFKPSGASFSVTQDIVVKADFGDPLDLKNLTLFQKSTNARGTVNEVYEIDYSEDNLYQLSIDSGYDRDIDVRGTTFGKFQPNPKTKLMNDVAIGATILDVDSTVSFPETGNLEIIDVDGNEISIAYTGKTVNQFLNVSGVNAVLSEKTDVYDDDFAFAFVGINTSDEVRVKVTSTLKNLNTEKNYFYNKSDTINIKSFGIEDESLRGSKWMINSKTRFDVQTVSLVDILESKYSVVTYDGHYLKPGYSIKLTDNAGTSTFATVEETTGDKSFTIKAVSNLNTGRIFFFETQILKPVSDTYSFLNKFTSNIQNTYTKFNGDVLVASNSLPFYSNVPLNPYNKSLTFTGSAAGNIIDFGRKHGFFNGDSVYYEPSIVTTTTVTPDGFTLTTETESKFDNLNASVFYVKKVDDTRIMLARSRADLFRNRTVELSGSVTDNKFTYYDFYSKPLAPQKLYREFINPIRETGSFETLPGYNGMFINGVELLNYKSGDSIFSGPIEELIVTSEGTGYDVVNPPNLVITDTVGTGATGTIGMTGTLDRIDIIDTGFDFVETPVVSITGGNPVREAKAEVNLSPVMYSLNFNSEFKGGNIDYQVDDGKIGFGSFHRFRQDERIIYDSRGLKNVGGLSTDSSYFVNVVDNFTITLHHSVVDSRAGINTILFGVDFGVGTQTLKSATQKNIVTSVIVTDPGEGYKNRKKQIPSAGIITALNQVNIDSHGFKTGETILYTPGSTAVQGISSTTNYLVTRVDDDNFKLSDSRTNFNNKVFVNITGVGTGSFNYEPIVVRVDGVTGIDTRGGQDFQCRVQSLFRGSVESIDMTDQGSGYGAPEIINLNKQPFFSLESGKDAQVMAVVSNGRFVDVVVTNEGEGYVSPPDLKIVGVGSFAKLTPIITDGKLTEVKIINPGLNYVTDKTTIELTNPGKDCAIEAKIKEWNINLFARDSQFVDGDDGYVDENIAGDETQYCHLYTPRQLRETTYVLKNGGETFFGLADLEKVNGIEVTGTFHSPIVGWAYDGNPIYGPQGYSTPSGGIVKQLKTGYEVSLDLTHRPPISLYPEGFFIEDFKFTDNGDLDIHNGRFGVTPDFPEGVYAYFTTVESFVDGFGPFKNYKKPQFPYVIGNTLHSKKIDFNYRSDSNQTDYDLESNKWFRNTKTYNTNKTFSGYDYIFDSNKIKKQTIDIKSSTSGPIKSVGIFTGGDNYKVNDKLVFDNSNTTGGGAQAKVSRVGGEEVRTVSTATTSIQNVEFVKYFGVKQFVGFTSVPHNLKDKELVNINGLSDYYKGFDGPYNVGVRTESFVVSLGIGSTAVTGLTTYFYVGGALEFPFIRPNDVLGIGTEKVLVLNIDAQTERIRVLREYESVGSGSSYSSGSVLLGDPRRFNINVGSTKTDKSFRVNEELYFDPSEAVGIASTAGNGVGTVVTFRDPGVGPESIFIPSQSIFYKDHGLRLNDKLAYSPNSGTSLNVFNGIGTTTLTTYDELFATPITKDLIGISSHKVGLATDGGYVGIGTTTGLFFFTDSGTGDYHSFTTLRTDILRAAADRHIVTVSTASTHGLRPNDNIRVSIKPTTTDTIDVRYNDFNRRIVFNPVGFTSDKIDAVLNTIRINDHDFITGDKVIHTSSDPTGGLTNEAMYYVVSYDKDSIRLVDERFEIQEEDPNFKNLTSSGLGGTLSRINPLVTTRKNSTLKFDLSDSSLSFLSNGVSYSAFNMAVYLDQEFNKKFVTTGKKEDKSFEVTTGGIVGISTDANLSVEISDFVPTKLYYKFDTINPDIITESKRGIVIDEDAEPFNQINIEKSKYDGSHVITGTGSTTFVYELKSAPESLSYDQTNSLSSYTTNSLGASGPITEVEVTNGGNGYKNLPKVDNVTSGFGTGAILEAESTEIGSILTNSFNSDNIGFDYPTDETLRPVANLPEILEMESLTSFEFIGISSFGRNYLHPAKLVVVDGYTKKVVPEVDLRYELGDTEVTILQNPTGMYEVEPRIVPTQNTNGVGISSLSYDSGTNIVRLFLNQIFTLSRDFPFNVGTKILVENISIVGGSGRGYNSSDYDYVLFPIITAVPNFGGTGAYVEYDLSDLLNTGEVPGTVTGTLGQIVSESYFPIFNSTLKTNEFFKGETVINGENRGTVESWISNINQLKVDAQNDFDLGTVVRGQSSNTQAVILRKHDFNAEITTGVGATVVRGWQNNIGFLNDNLQVLPNNEYYQNFSYSLSSRVPYDTWNDPVSNLNHTSGFAKFADYQLESVESDEGGARVSPIDTNVEIIIDIVGEGDLNCHYDFDFVSEGFEYINGNLASNEIFFENRILTDYFQSIGNRVLSIDDISDQFNSNARAEPFEPIARFESNYVFNKVFTFAQDNIFKDERQFSIVNIIQNGLLGFINEYAIVETYPRLGFYDYEKTGDGWDLTFNPVKFKFNNYEVSTVAISLLDGVTGTGSTTFGDIVTLESQQATIPTGTTTTIATFPTSNRAAKILTMVEATSGIASGTYDATELNVIHDGTTVFILEYGDMQSDLDDVDTIGLGTFFPYISGSDVKIDFIPGVTGPMQAEASLTLISDTGTTEGNMTLNVTDVKSQYRSIASSGSPSAVGITTYLTPYSSSYNVVVVTDTTNNQYEMFEAVMCNSGSNENIVDYGNVETLAKLGTVGMSSISGGYELTFTPNAGIDVEVRTFGIDIKIDDGLVANNELDQNNVIVTGTIDDYRGTEFDVKTDFELTHDGNNIFQRRFDGSSSSVVNITAGSISLANHFFVTGEEVVYAYSGAGTTQAIGIVTATVGGVSTDKLPTSLFVIKIDEGNIKFASTAEKALAVTPEILQINAVGVGNSHTITATNQNAKALVAVDNMIQAPVSPTDITTELFGSILFDEVFSVTGITSFASGDIIRVNNEFMITQAVGVAGSTAFGVRRAQLGTNLGFHSTGATITKMSGNYNILDNTINFASAPYGNTPLSTTSAATPDQRDWTGITTSSRFQGRTFMRTAPVGTTSETYSKNVVFDDISTQFNGIGTDFNLKREGSETVGYSTDNGIILINNIFQTPQGSVAGDGTYTMTETSGITSIRFTGSGVTTGYDPNNSNIPLGGIIVSVGSDNGFGYQPLVAAGGSVTVSAAGTISNVSIANSGSGYRNGLQLVSVGVQQPGGEDLVAIGTATISDGHITDVSITNSDVFYVPRDVSNVGYSSITGVTTVTTSTDHGLSQGDTIQLSGIAFTCDYSGSGPVDISNAVYDNVSGIMTVTTSSPHNLSTTGQKSDVLLTGIAFTCGLDGGASTHIYPRTTDPVYCGTKVLAVNSSTEFEINAGVSTVPTFYQSGGVSQPVLIAPRAVNNSASGIDPAHDGSTIIEVINSTTFVVNTGISTRTHFYARCGKVGKPFDVVFDEPLSYSNIPLQYSSSSTGVGQSATVNIVVGQGSSVIDFEFGYTGFGYGNGEILTVPVGGLAGIPTDTSLTFSEFQITIDEIFTDNFNGFSIGQLEVLDKFDDLFDGFTKDFRLLLNNIPVSIQAAPGSSVEVDQTLLIFLNDTLQEPGKGYIFSGGSTIEFTEPPKVGDTSKVIFYKGGGDTDVVFTDIIETVKVGDTLNIDNLPPSQGIVFDQESRTVIGINTLDSVKTNTYQGPGISTDRSLIRPIKWCRQTSDKIINGLPVGKDRIKYEPQIYPTSYMIQPISIASTEVYVDSVRPLFTGNNEAQVKLFQNSITVNSQDSVVGATGTATVSAGGTISSITITNPGVGYTVAPTVTIGSTIGVSTIATATVSITSGEVTSVSITNGGVGYTGSQVPVVLFEEPSVTTETINVSSYEGDYGKIVGVGTTNSGSQQQLEFDLFIPVESFMRSGDLVGTGITISGISTGDFLTIFDTNVSIADTFASQDESGVTVGLGTTHVDNVYKVIGVARTDENVLGVGITAIQRITVNIDTASTLGFTTGTDIGEYSWGKIMFDPRTTPKEFNSYTMNGYVGISTSGLVRRTTPLRFSEYI